MPSPHPCLHDGWASWGSSETQEPARVIQSAPSPSPPTQTHCTPDHAGLRSCNQVCPAHWPPAVLQRPPCGLTAPPQPRLPPVAGEFWKLPLTREPRLTVSAPEAYQTQAAHQW